MAKFNLTNEAPGARGYPGGLVEAGQTLSGVELTDEQAAHVRRFGLLRIEPADEGDLHAMKVADLKALAEAEDIDLGDAIKKDDIIAAIELAREEKAKA